MSRKTRRKTHCDNPGCGRVFGLARYAPNEFSNLRFCSKKCLDVYNRITHTIPSPEPIRWRLFSWLRSAKASASSKVAPDLRA